MSNSKLFPLGPQCEPGEVALEVLSHELSYKNFVRVETYSLRTRGYNGEVTQPYMREIMSVGPTASASVLLPYDPVRDVVVLIEQLRLPSYIAKRTNGWTLEPVAGLIEVGDDPETTARRECLEECNREAKRVVKIGHYMPSPGAFTEVIHLFVGEIEAGEGGDIAGLEAEHEYIRTHVLSFDEAMQLVDSNQIDNGNCLIALNWLARHRERLRKEWR